jgi:hypothetical protein
MSRRYVCAALALTVVIPWASVAQIHVPLVEIGVAQKSATVPQAEAAIAPAVPRAQAARPPATTSSRLLGAETRGLLSLQAGGEAAGADLPMLGAASTAAYNRYLESFKQPIPQWFNERINSYEN